MSVSREIAKSLNLLFGGIDMDPTGAGLSWTRWCVLPLRYASWVPPEHCPFGTAALKSRVS